MEKEEKKEDMQGAKEGISISKERKTLSAVILEFLVTVLVYSGYIWVAGNIFTRAFGIGYYITYIQSVAILIVLFVIGTVLRQD